MKLFIISSLLFAAISAYYIQPNYGYNPYPLQPNPFGPGPHGFGSFIEPYNYRRDYNRRHHGRYSDEDSGEDSGEYYRPRRHHYPFGYQPFGYQPFGYQPVYQTSYGISATPVSSDVATYGSK